MVVKLLILEEETTESQASIKDYCQSLNSKDYELIFAFSGEEALEIIEQDRNREIDLLISGLSMPTSKIDGWQLIKTLARHQIDLKILVVSAWGKLEDFDEESRQNIIFFTEKKTISKEILKYLVESSLRLPERFTINSQKVRFDTLLKSAKDLPSKQKIKLIEKLLGFSDLKDLRQFKTQLPQLIEQSIDGAIDRDRIRQWLREKEKSGQIEFTILTDEGSRQKIPVCDLNYFYIDRKNRHNSIYCEIRWWWEGSLRYTNVPKYLLNELLPLLKSIKI